MPSSHAVHWSLDPRVRFLNHGSYGACPKAVLNVQLELRAALEREPVLFMGRELGERIDRAREALAAFLGSRRENLVFVPNATTGVNAVLRSIALGPGDELLITNHGYNACNNAARFVTQRCGARLVEVELPFPVADPTEITGRILEALTPATRLVLIDHITSPTALVLPLEELLPALRERGVATLVDGAHAPGMLHLDLESLGADYYTGNCHKWMCTPKGSAFLWVRPELQESVRPVVISHGANTPRPDHSRFQTEFDWCGTSDPTAYLAIPAAIEFFEHLLPGGWAELRRHNHELALSARRLLLEALDIPVPVPASMIGAIASIPLPGDAQADAFGVDPLQIELFERDQIEIPIHKNPSGPGRLIRLSAQLYNSIEDYQGLADALAKRL